MRALRRAVLAVTIATLAACSGAGPLATGSAPSGSPAASPAESPAGSGSADGGSVTAAGLQLDNPNGPLAALGDREAAARTDGRASADMVGYLGPDATAAVGAIDRQESDGLLRLVDQTAVARRPEPLIALAVAHPFGGGAVRFDSVLPPGISTITPAVTAMMIVDSTSPSAAASQHADHQQTEISAGPNSGTITTDSTVSVTPAGGQLTVDVIAKTSGSISDASGKLLYRIESTAHAHIEMQACPDAQGIAAATISFGGEEYYFIASEQGSAGHSWKIDETAQVGAHADDAANLDKVTVDITARTAVQGGTRAAGAGQSSLVDYTVDTTAALTSTPDFRDISASGSFRAHGATREQVDKATSSAEETLALGAQIAANAAARFWRSGTCIEVVVEPNGGTVGRSSTTKIDVKVRQAFEHTELDKPVTASLSGPTSVEPAGQPLPAPASFTYTAGPKDGDTGTITFESTSNRGIGRTTVTFTVGGGWTADQHGGLSTLKGQKCDGLGGTWKLVATVNSSQIDSTATWLVTIDGTSLLGTYTYKSVTKSYPGIVTTESGNGKAGVAAQPDGTLKMTICGTTVIGTADGQSVAIPIPDQFFTWRAGGTCA